MRSGTNQLTPGQRVAYYRRRRGMSQLALAELVGKTLSWIEKVESGRANLNVLPNIVRLAKVLNIPPAELLPDSVVTRGGADRDIGVPSLRERLLSYRFVNPTFLTDDTPPVTLPQLVQAVGAVWSAYQASRFGYVTAELHRLLPVAAATAAAQTGAGCHQAEVQLAFAYQVAASVLSKLGEQDLAFACADRGERLVHETNDVAARISVQRTIAHALLSTGQYGDAMAVVEHTLGEVPAGSLAPRVLSAAGTLHLVGAITSARIGQRSAAAGHLVKAEAAAIELGRDANHLWTAFGPTNVAIHRVSVAAELGDFQRASTLGESVDVSPMPMERQVRHRLEVARSLHYQRQQRDALGLVLVAESKAPDQVRQHFLTRLLVQEWVSGRGLNPSPELHGLARRTGMLAA